MLDSLEPSRVVGIDLSPIALSLAEIYAPAATLVCADINQRLPFADGEFDVATIFNVLYHEWVQSETQVLAEAARVLRPGGLLLITEPAFDFLRREMDVAVMTRRRYHTADFAAWLDAAGFETAFQSYFTAVGVPILLAAKYLNRRRPRNRKETPALDMRPIPKLANEILRFVATIELRALVHGIRMPFGTTLVCVARRREESRRQS
jgi:SAM-dependent methyltransferase